MLRSIKKETKGLRHIVFPSRRKATYDDGLSQQHVYVFTFNVSPCIAVKSAQSSSSQTTLFDLLKNAAESVGGSIEEAQQSSQTEWKVHLSLPDFDSAKMLYELASNALKVRLDVFIASLSSPRFSMQKTKPVAENTHCPWNPAATLYVKKVSQQGTIQTALYELCELDCVEPT